VSGTAGNDTISGVIGNSSGTYSFGDDIRGGSGTDTINILDGDGTAVGIVALDSVENVNVRVLVSGGGNITELNAADWSGVATLTNASSTDDSELQVSGLTIATDVTLYGETTIGVNFANLTSGTDTATVSLIGAGSARSASTYASANTEGGLATIDVDLDNGGLVDGVNIQASGTNYVTLEGGADLRTINVSGSGALYMATDDLVTGFNAAGFNGGVQITFNGASDVNAIGGSGNDTFLFGTTFGNADSVDGGAGTDTIRATIAGFNRNLNTTNVENAVLTFSDAAGGDVNASASTVTGFTFAAGTAGNAASVSQMANASTVTLNDDDLGNVTLDYASGAATTTINIGSPSGAVGIGTLAITDVAAVTINAVGVSGTVGGTITTASFDSDLKSLTIATSGGEADLTIGTDNVDMSLGGATSLTLSANGSAAILFNTVDLAGSALASVAINANNSDEGDVTVGDISGSAITTVTLTAVSGGDITVGTLDLGNNHTATTQDTTISIVQGQTSNVIVGNITVSGQGTLTLNVTQNGTASADIGTITLDRIAGVTADTVAQNLTLGAVTVAGSGEVAINNIDVQAAGTGAQVTIGAVTVTKDGGWSAGSISGTATVNVDVGTVTIDVGASATATLGAITLTGGAVGAITLTLASDATATFGSVDASAISTHTIVANTGASANFGNMVAYSGGNASQGRVGAIEIAGVDGADVQFGTIAASAVGAIAVSGALDVTFGTITTTSLGEVNNTAQGVSGSFTIDLSGVTNAVEVKLGVAQNVVISGLGNDVITLTGGRTATAGNDVIRFTTSTQNTDNIVNFIAGAAASGGDQIEFDVSEFGSGLVDSDGSALAAAADIVFGTASGAAVTLNASANLILFTTAYANTAALITDAQADITNATATKTSGTFLIGWTDGSDTYVSLLSFEEGASATDGLAGLASASGVTVTTLASLQGVTPGALLAAANFDVV